jgi:hypothetical protein
MSNRRSTKQEAQIAKDVGGKRQTASGALPYDKLDVLSQEFLIEAKYTDRASYSVNKKQMAMYEMEARKVGRLPALVVDFGKGQCYVLLRYEEFLHYNELFEDEMWEIHGR